MLNDGFMATDNHPTPPRELRSSQLLAIDLRDLPADKMTALRRAAISEGIPLNDYLARIVAEKSGVLLGERLGTAA